MGGYLYPLRRRFTKPPAHSGSIYDKVDYERDRTPQDFGADLALAQSMSVKPPVFKPASGGSAGPIPRSMSPAVQAFNAQKGTVKTPLMRGGRISSASSRSNDMVNVRNNALANTLSQGETMATYGRPNFAVAAPAGAGGGGGSRGRSPAQKQEARQQRAAKQQYRAQRREDRREPAANTSNIDDYYEAQHYTRKKRRTL